MGALVSAVSSASEDIALSRKRNAPEIFISRLRSEDAFVRWKAATVLGRPKSVEAFEPLKSAVKDPDRYVAIAATKALAKAGQQQSLSADDIDDDCVWLETVSQLGASVEIDENRLRRALNIARSESVYSDSDFGCLIARLPVRTVESELRSALAKPEYSYPILSALIDQGTPEAFAYVEAMLNHQSPRVVYMALLAALKTPLGTFDDTVRTLLDHPDAKVRRGAQFHLNRKRPSRGQEFE